jgi:hypothetical protein
MAMKLLGFAHPKMRATRVVAVGKGDERVVTNQIQRNAIAQQLVSDGTS